MVRGTLLAVLFAGVALPHAASSQTPPAFLLKWGTGGNGDGQFVYPRGVAVDLSGDVYVADQQNYRIQKFDNDGVFVTKWGASGAGQGLFGVPGDVSVGVDGLVYVLD